MLIKQKTLVLIVGALWIVGLAGLSLAQSADDAPVVYTNKDLPSSGVEADSGEPVDASNDSAEAAAPAAPADPADPAAPAAPAVIQVQPAPEGAFTNYDLGRLSPAGNSALPELGEDTNPPAGPADAPAPAPADNAAAIEWLDEVGRSVQLDAAIADAQRRVRDATAKLERLAGGLRPKGSAFESGRVTTEDLYVYDVTDDGSKRDALLAELRSELDAAKLELSRLLATQ